MIEPRLVVTGIDAEGRETCLHDAPAPATRVRWLPGQDVFLLWGSDDGTAQVGVPVPTPTVLPFFAGVGGTRLLLVRFPPLHTVGPPVGDPEAVLTEARAVLPGLVEVFEPGDDSGMHTTDTLDYGVLLEGELWLELDDGSRTLFTPGTCVVQNGTRHAWRNRGTVPALMVFVGIGAERAG